MHNERYMTEFQQKVYDFVRTIPRGKTVTYKEVAVAIGHPRAYRAVGNALNKNPYIGKITSERESNMKRILLVGGGSGGHVYPVIAVANALKEKASEAGGLELLLL